MARIQFLGSCRNEFGIKPRVSTAAAEPGDGLQKKVSKIAGLSCHHPAGGTSPAPSELSLQPGGAYVLLPEPTALNIPKLACPPRAAGGLLWL